MCGLVGVAGKLVMKDEELMKRLFCYDYWRGRDSTGLAAIRATGERHIAKIASHPIDLFDMGKFKTALNGNTSQAFIGHNRAATKGKVNTINAHPFEHGHIVGAHNGTLTLKSHRELEDILDEQFEVDSEAIIKAIAELGVRDAISLCQGAWALSYYNAEEHSLNFIRNGERPLWFAYSESFDKLFWASEYWMIDAACDNMNVKLAVHENKETGKKSSFFSFGENFHYKFDLKKLKEGSESRPKPVIAEMRGKEEPKTVCGFNGDDPFIRDSQSSSNTGCGGHNRQTMTSTACLGKTNTRNNVVKIKDAPTDPRIIDLFGDKDKPWADFITEEQFNKMVGSHKSCTFCSEPVAFDDVGVTIYMRDNIVLCNECSPQSSTQNRVIVTNLKQHQ